jgi:hypothetical protein
MDRDRPRQNTGDAPQWLLLLFSLPTKQASQRVEVWRKLKRYGALPLPAAGYLLPCSPENWERFEWLAGTIRDYKGQATVAEVQRIDNLPAPVIARLFREARGRDYDGLFRAIEKAQKDGSAQRKLTAFRKRLDEISEIDYFDSPVRVRVGMLLNSVKEPTMKTAAVKVHVKREFANRTWVTRPRPGIDRVSSSWLITRYIDSKAKFIFAQDPAEHSEAVPFDMFGNVGFGHQGDCCTFETLLLSFRIRDRRAAGIAEIVHDADLADGKFGRMEGAAIEAILAGWRRDGIPDHELLRRGMELVDGLYQSSKERE